LLGIGVGAFVEMWENSVFALEWNPQCRVSLWKNRSFNN
jgi:hypothetical protein